ncbi:unnamed protein product [Ectocarpus sp. 6 AP-2014]
MAFEDPKFPVTDPAPGMGTVFGNLNATDVATVVVATAGSAAWCFKGVKGVRGPNAVVGASLGLMGGLMLAGQNSFGRLTGQRK